MNSLIIVGAGGHGKVIADIAEHNGYTNIAFLDDNTNIKQCGNYKVIGECKDAQKQLDSDFIIAIGNATIRRKLQAEFIEYGLHMVSLIHPNAVIAPSVNIGIGTVIMAGVVINPSVEIGEGCIINTCASIDHDSKIGNFVHVSIGSHVAGSVSVGDCTWIGAGATVSNNIKIIGDCMIGAGAVVVNNITESNTYVGVPAGKIRA